MKVAIIAFAVVVTLALAVGLWRKGRRVPVIPDTADEFLAATVIAPQNVPLFGDPPGTPFPGPAALRWAYSVLHQAGVDADADPSYAASILRSAEPRLTSDQAKLLIHRML